MAPEAIAVSGMEVGRLATRQGRAVPGAAGATRGFGTPADQQAVLAPSRGSGTDVALTACNAALNVKKEYSKTSANAARSTSDTSFCWFNRAAEEDWA